MNISVKFFIYIFVTIRFYVCDIFYHHDIIYALILLYINNNAHLSVGVSYLIISNQTNSITAISAASPLLGPILMMRV